MVIREMPRTEQPLVRAQQYGFGALSNAELLSIVSRSRNFETCVELIDRARTLTDLAKMTIDELGETAHIGPTIAWAIKAGLELGQRMCNEIQEDRPRIGSPSDAANLVMAEMMHLEQEHMRVLLLDNRNRVITIHTACIGSGNTVHIQACALFREAIKHNASSIILAHNHPSGDPTPSPDDIRTTEDLVDAGELLGIDVMDHLIIGHRRFVSLKERRLGFR